MMSEECQMEVNKVFNPDGQQRTFQGDAREAAKQQQITGEDPTAYILAIVAIAFVAVGVKVYNISQDMKNMPTKPRKKLSKRKQLKQKIKEQQRK